MSISLKSKALPAGLALMIFVLGVPQTIDSTLWLMTGDTPDQIGQESPSSADRAMANAALLEKADAWTGDPEARIRAGVLRLRLSGPRYGAQGPLQFNNAIDDLVSGLSRSPAEVYAWMELAESQFTAGNFEKTKRMLEISMLLSDYNPYLSLWRCDLAFRIWPILDADDRWLIANQVIYAWDPKTMGNGVLMQLVDIAKRGDYAASFIRAALAQDPDRSKAFDLMFNAERQ